MPSRTGCMAMRQKDQEHQSYSPSSGDPAGNSQWFFHSEAAVHTWTHRSDSWKEEKLPMSGKPLSWGSITHRQHLEASYFKVFSTQWLECHLYQPQANLPIKLPLLGNYHTEQTKVELLRGEARDRGQQFLMKSGLTSSAVRDHLPCFHNTLF